METNPTVFAILNRTFTVSACWILLALPTWAGPAASGNTEQVEARHLASIEEAQELLRMGDASYEAGRYADAVQAFAGAREMISNVPASAELHQAATQRFAQASVEHARELSRKGDMATAKLVMDKVLDPEVAPNDPGAQNFRAELDDPIRNNPALTAEHAKEVDSVRRHLYTAEGAFNLGKFDQAIEEYQKVLLLDPTNRAARRGMEQVAAVKSDYHAAAFDHTRAELLGEVDAAWEMKIPAPEVIPSLDDPSSPYRSPIQETVSAKLKNIIVPQIALDQVTLFEAIDYLRVIAGENSDGVNFTINLGPAESEVAKSISDTRFDLRLASVPMSTVLKYITDLTKTSYTTDDFSVVIRPFGASTDELMARTFRVPPDFLTNITAGAEGGATTDDPFAEQSSGGSLLTTRLSAQEALARQGITFPQGAYANYNAATNSLNVYNTSTNIDFIAQVVEAVSQTEPVQVVVRVTMIRTEKTNLEELGFDWLLMPKSEGTWFAAGGTTGNSGGRTAADFSTAPIPGIPAQPNAIVNPGIVTNGLRSGDQAISGNAIDSLTGNIQRAAQSTSVAPGILSLTGLFTDGDVQAIMRGLDQKKGVDVMAQPSTVTRSGQASTVSIVREFIYPTEYEPPELPTGNFSLASIAVTPATPTAFETRDTGITLEVLPLVSPDKRYVDVTISPSFVEFDGFINYGSPINALTPGFELGPLDFRLFWSEVQLTDNAILMPVFNTQKANTQLSVADGSTIAFGGLLSNSSQIVEDKVPVLGDLPWVGRLFSSNVRENSSTAIIFLVRVEVIDPTGQPYRSR